MSLHLILIVHYRYPKMNVKKLWSTMSTFSSSSLCRVEKLVLDASLSVYTSTSIIPASSSSQLDLSLEVEKFPRTFSTVASSQTCVSYSPYVGSIASSCDDLVGLFLFPSASNCKKSKKPKKKPIALRSGNIATKKKKKIPSGISSLTSMLFLFFL